ncbi:GGDEF domain-containing protein [Marinobacter sp. HL-58]|uniref:sensor domain-containing diguanylate cyclase n=1 Tax=Marinobacter sp. HL-58 TaxID=1479237 RepID=UPI00056732FD|nr:GGDEF domain-containing protein [Marinobacter sp. HL-58]KPQ02876.1 MAG: diguanylate cyclase (GGDEF) domain [Marinobacter sp. HL-58]
MRLSGPAIPEKWLPAYEAHLQALEDKVALVAAWLLLITVVIYQFSHPLRNIHSSEFFATEFLLRLPVILMSSLTLLTHYSGRCRWPSRYFLRLMGLSVMAMILSMLLLYQQNTISGLYQISNGLVISFFGVSVLAVRGIREWALLFLLPLSVFAAAVVFLGISFTAILPLFFDPLMMMLIGMIVMEALRRILASEFEARQRLGEMASTDQLTGLLNRRAIWPLLNHELDHAQRAGTPFSLILGDLDLFKKVNDTYGHGIGDMVLQETARRLGNALRRQDILCRWGGEELLVLLPDTDSRGALQVAEKLRAAMADSAIAAGNHHIHQTISLGVASFQQGDTIEAITKRSDEALYQAKHRGRNRVEVAAQ